VPDEPLKRSLGLFDATSLLAGTVIGAGVFIVPSIVASRLTSFSGVLGEWVLGGVLMIAGALSLGELGAAFPDAGGLYIYLSRAYGRFLGFLYGWGLFAVIHSGSVAGIAVGFSLYLARVLSLSPFAQRASSVGTILILTVVNIVGVRAGKGTQNFFTIAKIGGLAAMVVVLFRAPHTGMICQSFWPAAGAHFEWHAAALSLVVVLWAYEGWHLVSFTAGEVKNPGRNLPLSYLYGGLIVILCYVVANIAYYAVLTPAQIRNSSTVAASAMTLVAGPVAGNLISLLILVSIFGSLNGAILTGPRVYYAMAHDGIFFRGFSRISPRLGTPVVALVAQAIWASVLAFQGSYEELATSVIFASWIFYGLTVAGVIVLRRRQPELQRPYRVPGYPWLPAAFCLGALGAGVEGLVARPVRSVVGIGLILTGVPLYLWFRRRSAPGA
jgi:basic amino acid/polyamine antiporter, APA family